MTYSQNLLTSFKAKNGGCSDYMAAKKLGFSRQYISMIKNGKAEFSEEIAVEIAKQTEMDLKIIALGMLASSVKSDEMRKAVDELMRKLDS